jgi:OOP family OmpA-OmpF porin
MKSKRNHASRGYALGAALILALTATPMAFAAEGGWYLGGSVGSSRVDIDEAQINSLGSPSSTSSNEIDTGLKLFGGFQFNKNWAVEVAYIDLGKFTANNTDSTGTLNLDFKIKGWNVAGVGTLPVSESFAVFGKLGVLNWNLDYKCATASGTAVCNAPTNRSASGTDLSYGVGLDYALTKQVGLRLEWERFKDVGDPNNTRGTDNGKTGQSDADLLSVGVKYNF